MAEIRFPSASPFTLRDVPEPSRCLPLEGLGRLFLPDGAGSGSPRPAVVVLEGLGGVIPERELRYGAMLAREGYVALAVDSFRPRGVQPLAHPLRALKVTEAMMLADAFAALRWLAALPLVDRDRVAVIGFSYGAMVSVFSAYRQIQELYAPGERLRFAAHVSFYGCTVARLTEPATTGAPVRLFVGGLDRNVCVERTHLIAGDLERGGSEVRVHHYPDAYHQWDSKDREKKFVRFSLRRYAFVVEPDNTVWDTRTRLILRGPVTRTAALALNMDPTGYEMLRDERIMARSDRELLDFLAAAIGRGAAPRARPAEAAATAHPGGPGAGARSEAATLRRAG